MKSQSSNYSHAKKALNYVSHRPLKILIGGAGKMGADAEAFEMLLKGDYSITGVDISPDVGKGSKAEQTIFMRGDLMNLPFKDDSFDLCFSFAVFEHVPDILRAWQEMSRVTKELGYIYTVAAPLWGSPYGHHKKEIFKSFPWVHLLHPSKDQMETALQDEAEFPFLKKHIGYITNPKFFNMTLAGNYLAESRRLNGLEILKNEITQIDLNNYPKETVSRVKDLGFSDLDISGISHTFIARKMHQTKT